MSCLCTAHSSLVESFIQLEVATSSPLVLILLHSGIRQAPTLEYPAYHLLGAESGRPARLEGQLILVLRSVLGITQL